MDPKVESVVWIFCIVILVSLSMKLAVEQATYDCSKCEVEFSSSFYLSDNAFSHEPLSVETLFNELNNNGTCLAKWDVNSGWKISTVLTNS